jgi:hypothetical protein
MYTGVDWLTDDAVRLMPEGRYDWIGFQQLFCGCLDDLGLNMKYFGATRLAFVRAE